MQNRAFRVSEISLSWTISLRELNSFLNLGIPAKVQATPHNQDMICIFVVLEAQLLAIRMEQITARNVFDVF